MADDTQRSVDLKRTSLGQYEARNARGGTITVGTGDGTDFTPVELLLAALGGCTGADVDYITSKRAEPENFVVHVTGDKVRDEAERQPAGQPGHRAARHVSGGCRRRRGQGGAAARGADVA
nr:hypothetical protein GCM10020092_079590 [Actinoplanes digitatis]